MVLHKFLSKSLRLLAVNKFMTDIFFHLGITVTRKGKRKEQEKKCKKGTNVIKKSKLATRSRLLTWVWKEPALNLCHVKRVYWCFPWFLPVLPVQF